MKKLIFLLGICCLITACNQGDKAEKIREFWTQQSMLFLTKVFGDGSPMLARGAVPPEQINEEDMQNFEEMVKEWEQSQPEPVPAAVPAPGPQGNAPGVPGNAPGMQGNVPGAPVQTIKKKAPRKESQFMEIVMDEPSGAIKGKAPLKDRKAMQKAIDKVLQDNQDTVEDIGAAFGAEVQAQAFAITTKTEKTLRKQAAASTSLKEYLTVERQLLKKQEQSLNQLMKNSSRRLRSAR